MDVSYGGENGFNQAIELASETLGSVKLIQEKRLLQKYFDEISQVCMLLLSRTGGRFGGVGWGGGGGAWREEGRGASDGLRSRSFSSSNFLLKELYIHNDLLIFFPPFSAFPPSLPPSLRTRASTASWWTTPSRASSSALSKR